MSWLVTLILRQVGSHFGYPTDFGFRPVVLPDGQWVLEMSNDAPVNYELAGTVFTM